MLLQSCFGIVKGSCNPSGTYIQNESMKVVLGCPKTAKLEVLRAELDLPSIVCRIQEITCCALCRMACNGANQPLRSLAYLRANPKALANSYLRKLFISLTKFDVLDSYLRVVTTSGYPALRPHKVSVDIVRLAAPQHNWLLHELKDHFMQKLFG